jgi:hypothetical protein
MIASFAFPDRKIPAVYGAPFHLIHPHNGNPFFDRHHTLN